MRPSRRKSGFLLSLSGLALSTAVLAAYGAKKESHTLPGTQMDGRKQAVHALNRLAFGPLPGDVQRIEAMGVDKWIELQLHPEKIDDTALEAHLSALPTLRMSTKEIVEKFPPPQAIKAVAEGKQRLPSDPATRAVYKAQLDKYEEKQERKTSATETNKSDSGLNASANPDKDDPGNDPQAASRREARMYADLKSQEILDLPPDQRMQEILRMSPDEQRALASPHSSRREELMEGLSPQQKETILALNNPAQVVISELMQAKLLRTIYSQRQLEEVMTDFWFNHFNIFINKGADRYLLTSYERDVIRPRALGKFEDLLVATAKSPAMLFYLDNWLSVGPDSDFAQGIPEKHPHAHRNRRRFPGVDPRPPRAAKGKAKDRHGLNENYARELMELHTLGVDGGYSQQDVTEVARTLTGWTIDQPKKGGEFKFESRMHEPGTKIVLGHKIKENGQKEGMEVLHILAHNPATAKFICTKLATRFVSDNPPPALVSRMSDTFLKKDGDIREVLRTLFRSPEFWAPEAYRAKVKTPLEFVASAVRAMGADVGDAAPLLRTLNAMGMLPYAMQPPTGYSMKADAWINSSALLSRMNFALALSSGKLKDVVVSQDATVKGDVDSDTALKNAETALLAGDVSRQTHETIQKQIQEAHASTPPLDGPAPSPNPATICGLILGSPEFQRR